MLLLVVDTQKLIMNDKLYCFDLFVHNVQKLIQTARENNIEVIYVRHDDGIGQELTKGTEGFDISDDFQPRDTEKIFDKTVNSPFQDTGLLNYLKEKSIQEIIVVGLQTEFCIDATVKCAFEHGFHVIVPSFANTTIDNQFMSGEESYYYYNEYIWNQRYAHCLSVEETIEYIEKNESDKGEAVR